MIYTDEDGNKWEQVYTSTNNDIMHIRPIQSEPKDKLKELRENFQEQRTSYTDTRNIAVAARENLSILIDILIEERKS